MKMSRRARRMEQYHKMAKSSGLNLVSLMDIFTILVFFLLVNSSSTQQLPNSKDMSLPSSISQKVPEETLIIAVTREQILLQGQRIASISETSDGDTETIQKLQEELQFLAADQTAEASEGRAITVMGHEEIPYQLIKKILKTCQQAGFTQIAFAAHQLAKPQAIAAP